MNGVPGSDPGSSRRARSISSASRRNSVQLVTDQTSAATSQSCASSSCASNAQRTPTPDASSCALALPSVPAAVDSR